MRNPRTLLPSLPGQTRILQTTKNSSLQIFSVMFFLFLVGVAMAPAQTFASMVSFDGSDGSFPQSVLVEGANGKLYGTAPYGGAYANGAVYEISREGRVTVLHSFDVTDGSGPFASLVRARNGHFYGVTAFGGLSRSESGTVFEIAPNGELTTLYNFCSAANCADGATPYVGLVEGSNGNLYGLTYSGGESGNGTVFEITPKGKLTTLYSFCSETNCTDGKEALAAALVQGRNGHLYGTTELGGANGSGTIFEITPNGHLTTLYNFCSKANCVDGETPFAALVLGKDGNFYGTASRGGAGGSGTIFKMTPGGELTTLHSFEGAEGGLPYGALVEGQSGTLYGTNYSGGASTYGGTVFEFTRRGKLKMLYSFCSEADCIDGRYPAAGLIQTGDRTFFGTTFMGGLYSGTTCNSVYTNFGCGTIFRLDLREDPPED